MEIPAPLMSGTITYFVLTLLAVFAGIGMGVTGKMDKENASYVSYCSPLAIALVLFYYERISSATSLTHSSFLCALSTTAYLRSCRS